MADTPIPFPDYTQPWIQLAEVDILAGATGEIVPNDFCIERSMVVERFLISAYDYAIDAAPAAPYSNFIPNLQGRYWRYKENKTTGPFRNLPIFDTAAYERTNWLGGAGGAIPMSVGWRLTVPIRLEMNESVRGQWSNPQIAVAGGLAGGTIFLALHGRGVDTGEHRVLHVPIVYGASAGGGAAGAGLPWGPGALSQGTNQYGEDINVHQILVLTDSTHYPVLDTRLFNHLRLSLWFGTGTKVRIGSDQWTYPLFCFGSHRALDQQVINFQPAHFPTLLDRREGFGWEFVNNSAQDLTVQVSTIGRVKMYGI